MNSATKEKECVQKDRKPNCETKVVRKTVTEEGKIDLWKEQDRGQDHDMKNTQVTISCQGEEHLYYQPHQPTTE